MKKNLKKLFLFVAVVVTAVVCFAFSVSAETWEDFNYKVWCDHSSEEYYAEIVGYIGNDSIVDIPSIIDGKSVTVISNSAFLNNDNIKTVVIPDSVIYIGYSAFAYCDGLESVIVGNGVTMIYDHAFAFCESLNSVSFGNNVTNVECSAFLDCYNIKKVYVADIETWLNIKFKDLESYPFKQLNEGELYFGNELVTEVRIPDNVITIENHAFKCCANIEKVTIPDSVTSIGMEAFFNCKNLNNINIGNNVEKIGSYAFENCDSLSTIKIPDSVTFVGDCVFSFSDNLKSVIVGNGVTSFGDSVFCNCISLASITIPESVNSLGENLFEGCNELTEVTINCSTGIYESMFSELTKLEKVTIGDKVTGIGKYAFSGCTNLKSVTIGDGITNIEEGTFVGCDNLANLVIGNSITSIDRFAFFDRRFPFFGGGSRTCDLKVTVDNLESWLQIKFEGLFASPFSKVHVNNTTKLYIGKNEAIDVVVPDSITEINNYAFYNCDSIKSIRIPKNVTSIGEYVFYDCNNLKYFDVSVSNETYSSDKFGVLFDKTKQNLYVYPQASQIKSYDIPNTVINIDAWAFNDVVNLEHLYIPKSVENIGRNSVFNYCDNLTSIAVDENNKNYSSDNYGVLFNKNKTTLIQYPKGNDRTFYSIPDSITSIDSSAFYKCVNLTSVTCGNRTMSIGCSVFSDCYNLTTITIPNSVISIDSSAFGACDSLTDVYYVGTEEQWKKISIDSENCCLTNANIHYNSFGPTLNEVPNGYKREHVVTNWANLNQSYKSNYLEGLAVPMDGTNGNPNYLIPGQAENMIPQGLTYWSEKDWILISSYDKEKENPSAIFALDRETGAFVAQFNLKKKDGDKVVDWKPHAGGIGVSDNNLYVSSGGGISYFPLSALDVEPGTVKDIVRASWMDAKQLNKANASYLNVCDGILWVGNFYSNYPGMSIWEELLELSSVLSESWDTSAAKDYNSLVLGYKLSGSSSEKEWENLIKLKSSATYRIGIDNDLECIQGIAFKKIDNDIYKMYLSRTTDVSFGAEISVATVTLNKKDIVVKKDSFSHCKNLPGTEGIVFIGDDLHILYESGALSTCDKLIESKLWSENLKNCTDVIWKVNEDALLRIPKIDSGWFKKSSYSGYNHPIAQFCADYCMLGYCYNESVMEYYLAKSGFSLKSCEMTAARDEVNYFIADKDIIVNGNTKKLIFIGCVGSYKTQWYSNFDPWEVGSNNGHAMFEGEKTHQGFASAREYIFEKFEEYILDNDIDKSNSIILLTGHSRGSATVNLLSAKLIDNASNYSLDANGIYTYGFATPNTTKNDTSDGKYSSIINVVNPEDFVTKVLPSAWGYGRYGVTYTLPSKTNDSNYKTYLSEMRTLFKEYTGDKYDPYKMGELKTYNIIEDFTNNVGNVEDFYNKEFSYSIPLFGSIVYKTPYDFFQKTLLKYLVSKDMDEIINVFSEGGTFYRDIIMYFAWPDISKSEIMEALLSDYNVIDGVRLGGKFDQAHRIETYCAYINSMTSTEVTAVRKGYKGSVNCPVDVEIYNKETGELVGRIVNNMIDEEISQKENSVVMAVNGESKQFWLPTDGNYDVKLIGNDEGTMDYTLTEVDSDVGETKRVNFFDVKIEEGLALVGNVEKVEKDFAIEEYTLVDEKEEVLKPNEITDIETIREYIINIDIFGEGSASESQMAKSGDYTILSAAPAEDYKFIGWFENGELVSDKLEFDFVAKSDRNFEVRFCGCLCHKPESGLLSFIWNALKIVCKSVGVNHTCLCGQMHY